MSHFAVDRTTAKASVREWRMAFSVRVRSGDTLTALARRFGVSVESLAHRNRLTDPNRLRVGQQLEVPSDELVVQKGDTLSALAWRAQTSVVRLARLNGLENPNVLQVGQRLVGAATPRFEPSSHLEPSHPEPSPTGRPPAGDGWSPSRRAGEAPRETPSNARELKVTPAQQLRVASALVSTGENLMRLRGTPLATASRALGASGAAIAVARMVGDARALRADVSEGGVSANSIESGSKLARNAVRVVRGLEQVVVSVVPRLAAHTVPGLSVASAALDTAVSAALESNPEASVAERDLARAAAVTSWVSALNIPIVSQVSGIASTGLGLWRDAYSDERRERLPRKR